ncbi:MAG TPA: hypothetical protein VK806_14090 [Bacteroidia bacterium]|nr:hypothetical protein [Bacteroidia bacterium]
MKNKKVKIETKYDKITKEEISSNKNFSNVHQNFISSKPHFFKAPAKVGVITKTVIVTTTITVVAFGAWKYSSSHSSSSSTASTQTAQSSTSGTKSANGNGSGNGTAQVHYTRTPKSAPYIHPPVKNINVPYKTYTVDANKANTIVYNKSKIKIPAKAFCDANGKEVTGKVDIKYREFHDPIDFFVSGIPMTYDSAGKQYTFESAGMLDMQGYKDGVPVNIKPDKTLKVEMASTANDIHYNIYELDTTKHNWVYVSKSNNVVGSKVTEPSPSKPVVDKEAQKETEETKTAIASIKKDELVIEKTKPITPKVYVDYNRVFNIDADKKEFPELAVYKNVLFEVDKSDNSFKPEYTHDSWEDASLKKNESGSSYTFTVKRASESHSFTVHPVFDQKDYQEAMKEYDKKYHDYETALNQKVEQEKKEEDAFAEIQRKAKEAEKNWQDAMARQISAQSTSYNVVCYFAVNKFGIMNCDHPGVNPTGASLAATYTDKYNHLLNTPCVYLVQKGLNSIYTIGPGANFNFNPKAINYAWCITDSNKIAFYSPEEFKDITQKSGPFTFAMAVNEKEVMSMEDIKAFFKPYM